MRARRLCVGHELVHLGPGGFIDERAEQRSGLGAAADGVGAHALYQTFGELRRDGFVHQQAIYRGAGLAAVAQLRDHGAIDGRVKIGILENNERSVAAELHGHPKHLIRRTFQQVNAHRGRSGE